LVIEKVDKDGNIIDFSTLNFCSGTEKAKELTRIFDQVAINKEIIK
jgi:hypothetical protein